MRKQRHPVGIVTPRGEMYCIECADIRKIPYDPTGKERGVPKALYAEDLPYTEDSFDFCDECGMPLTSMIDEDEDSYIRKSHG